MLGPVTLVGIGLLPAAGRRVAAGGVGDVAGVTVTDAVAGAFSVAWLFLVLMATIRTVTTVADVDQPATLLVSTSLPNAVVGTIGAELLVFATWLLAPTLLLSAAFAYGAGTGLPVVFAVLAVGIALVTAVPVGFVLGVCVRHLLTVYEPIARYRTPLVIALAVAYVGSIVAGWFDRLTALLFDLLGGSPLGWPGHLLAVGIPNATPSTHAAVGSLVGAVVLLPIVLAMAISLARIHWFAEPARTDDETAADDGTSTPVGVEDDPDDAGDHRGGTTDGRFQGILAIALDRPGLAVSTTAIRRTKRAPVRLLYVAYPLFGALFFAQMVVQAGYLPSYVAILLCVYVVWGTGVLFTLNPLGDLGRALPSVVTSTVTGREVVRGVIVAGTLVAVPVAVVVSLGAGLASPLSLELTAVLLVGTVVGAIASPALAVGVGSLFPRFGSVRVTNNREAVMPSKTAFLVYTLAIALPAASAAIVHVDDAPALIASVASTLLSLLPVLDGTVTVSEGVVAGVAWTALTLGLIAPLAGYRYATRRFDRFTIE